MSYKLFLDDEREPKQVKWITMPLGPWVVVRNYDQFVEAIKTRGLPTHISFDHDLGLEHYPIFENKPGMHIPYDSYKEKTGYHAAKFLIDYCLDNDLDLPYYTVHSMNVTGKENIIGLLKSYARFRKENPNSTKTASGLIVPR